MSDPYRQFLESKVRMPPDAVRTALSQWFTPVWAAQALVERYFSDLDEDDEVVEPTCGDGAFLRAIPTHVRAVGCEIDPAMAAIARKNSARDVIVGDFRTIPLTLRPTAIVGNPPFKSRIIDGVLRRCFEILQPDGAAGFILPAYYLQTPGPVVRHAMRWHMHAEMLPRTLFPSLTKPLVFVLFRKSERRAMVGMALYEEAYDIESMPASKELRRATWREVVDQAMDAFGDEAASMEAIYARVAPSRPSGNQWWQAKVRQTLQQHHTPVARGYWQRGQLSAAA